MSLSAMPRSCTKLNDARLTGHFVGNAKSIPVPGVAWSGVVSVLDLGTEWP